MQNPHNIIDTILVTEKSSELKDEFNKYVFKVNKNASKIEIGKAVEDIFDVKVKSVNLMNYKGKTKRSGRMMRAGRRSNWKKAVVTLAKGSIDIM